MSSPTFETISRLNAALEGRYRIEQPLGEGGMATVYLAHDVKHARKVALKVVKADVASAIGAARFLAEIGTTAALQHPHILPLFDSGEVDGLLFYVMPRVEGGSLKDRLDRERQLPVEEAVRITTALAEALDYAHRHGVVHRDIKPANILIHAGQPVISDFGISLAVSTSGADRLTASGLSLGTPLYMSPEQAMGDRAVGPATDVYALGCVLYEMLAGEPPHTGSNAQAIVAKVITSTPVSVTEHRKLVPPHVDAATLKALQRLPADRFASASDFARALAEPTYHDATVIVATPPHLPRTRISIALAAVVVVLTAANVWLFRASQRSAATGAVARFDVTPGDSQEIVRASSVNAVLAPDASWFVYVGPAPGGGTQLWRRQFKDLVAVPVAGTQNATSPAVSPDGRFIAFEDNGAVRTLSFDGGTPATIVTEGGAPAWGSDGMIYFGRNGRVYRVPERGGTPQVVTEPVENTIQEFIDVLPGGRGLLMTGYQGTSALARIMVAGPDGKVREILKGTMAHYVPTGHVIYATAVGTLLAVPFDLDRLEVAGPPVTLVEGIAVDGLGASRFALSSSGTLLYGTGTGSASELVWVSRDGKPEPVDPSWTGEIGSPAVSPDGKSVAVAIQTQQSMDVWLKQLDRGPSTRLTVDGDRNDYPTWTPDGKSVSFSSDRKSPSFDLWTKRADGNGAPTLEIDDPSALAETLWSPDGEWLIYRTSTIVRGAGDILARRRGTTKVVPLVASQFTETAPAISPNGRWLAYSSSETGRHEVFVVPFPNASSARWPISVGGGTEPLWSRDGRELFYRNGNGQIAAVRVETGETFSVGATTVLFADSVYRRGFVHRQYDVSPDGKRFLLIRRVDTDRQSRMILVQNFFEELKRVAAN